jgi:CheY-like chemotaxis protein
MPAGSHLQPAGARSERTSIDGLRVLVIEDEPDTREFLARFLSHHGATVLAAGSALEAIPLFLSERPDIVISDIGLPDVDGYELLRQIRQQTSRGATVPAIALTAYTRPEDRTRAFAAGFQAHLAKPLNAADLLSRIVEIVG